MKKLFSVLVAVVIFSMVITACKDVTPEIPVSITLSETQLVLDRYEDFVLTAVVKDSEGNTLDKEVTWSSSNNKVAKVSNGAITPEGVGNVTITAKVGSNEAACSVVVEDTFARPQIYLNTDNLGVFLDGTSTLKPSLKYKNKTVTGADFGYSVADSSVASVNNGKVKGLSIGSTTIIVTASWKGITHQDAVAMSKSVNVNVVEDIVIEVESAEAVIYSASAIDSVELFEGKTFVNKVTLEGSVIDRGEEVDGKWVTDNAAVATVDEDSGVVTGVGAGIANITLEYSSDYATYKSDPVVVSVIKPEVESTKEGIVTAADLTPDAKDFFPVDKNITAVYDITDENRINNLLGEDGKLNFVSSELVNGSSSAIAAKTTRLGSRQYIIENDTYAYKANILVATEIFTEIDSLLEVFDFGSAGQTWSGFYMLGGNIDADGAENKKGAWVGDANTAIGLTGTFDGRGYTISNMSFTQQGGLFGRIGLGGTVKNVGFDKAKVEGANCFVLAFFPGNGSVIDNIYINLTALTGDTTGALFSQINVWSGALPTISNIFIRTPLDLTDTKNKGAMFGRASTNASGAASGGFKCSFANAFVMSNIRIDGSAVKAAGSSVYGTDVSGVTRYATLLAAQAAEYPVSLKTGYWKAITAGEIPVFKSAVSAE